MKPVDFEIQTTEGPRTVKAEEILPGLFLHKPIMKGGQVDKKRHYVLSEKQGRNIWSPLSVPKKKLIPWVQTELSGFDWEKGDDFTVKQKMLIMAKLEWIQFNL